MDIEEFYDADPRRRSGEDRQFGLGWSDAADDQSLYDLYWNSGTGELYLMRKPVVDPLVGWTGYALEAIEPANGAVAVYGLKRGCGRSQGRRGAAPLRCQRFI